MFKLPLLLLLMFITPSSAFCSLQYAPTSVLVCPTVGEIKNKHFNQWLPLYIDGEELASRDDTEKFIETATIFEAAKWSWSYLESGHCFYGGGETTKKIVLAHDTGKPENSLNWKWTLPGRLAECVANEPGQCVFLN